MNPQGKRLLILGGQLKMCDIVTRAKELGIYTVVTDWYEDSPAKKIADKAYDVSTSDVDAVLKLMREERIDGVFTGFIDSTLPYYYEICVRAKLPCYLNRSTLECCTNKRVFKDVCRKVGIKTIPDVDLTNLEALVYPFLIKPSDNSGSKGITVCCNREMVPVAYDRAMRFSKSKTVVAERFMDCDYVCAYYAVINGEPDLTMLMDKDMNRIGRGSVPYPTALVYPSRYYDNYMENAHPGVRKLIRYLGMKNGTFLISFFVSGKDFFAVEMSVRLTATREYLFIKDATGIDTLEMHINHALTGEFTCQGEKSERERASFYCMLFTFIKDGIIGKIEGIGKVKTLPGVLNVLQLRDVGAKIRKDGSYGQLFSRIHLKAGSAAEMVDLVNLVQGNLQVYSTDGKPMVIAGLDAESFFA